VYHPLLFLIARRELLVGRSLVLEANFAAGEAEPAFAALPSHRLVQVYCSAPEDVVMERHLGRRSRRPGITTRSETSRSGPPFARGRHRPLALKGELIELETTRGIDTAELAARLR
jgi:hypothetical protein